MIWKGTNEISFFTVYIWNETKSKFTFKPRNQGQYFYIWAEQAQSIKYSIFKTENPFRSLTCLKIEHNLFPLSLSLDKEAKGSWKRG